MLGSRVRTAQRQEDTMERRDVLMAVGAGMAGAGVAPTAAAQDRPRSDKARLFKAVYLVKRKAGMSYDDYVRAQFEHTPLAHALPGLRHYVLDFYPPADGQDQPFDTAAMLYFETREAHDAALASPEGQAALADLPRFLDAEAMVVLFGHEEMDLPIAPA
jgi:uncharacterized protein (TIGR02118 family)